MPEFCCLFEAITSTSLCLLRQRADNSIQRINYCPADKMNSNQYILFPGERLIRRIELYAL